MIRTLTLVTLLALVAGLAMGFFVAEARAKAAPTPSAANPVVESKVATYKAVYPELTPAELQQIRLALLDYDGELQATFRRLRASHADEFVNLAKEANRKIGAVLEGKKPR